MFKRQLSVVQGTKSFEDEDKEEDKQSEDEAPDILIVPDLKQEVSETKAKPKSIQTTSIFSRQTKHTVDPELLKKLKTANAETLDQNEKDEKESEKRELYEINFLVKCTQNVKFFKDYDQDTHRQCMQKMFHVHLQKNESCCDIGSIGDTFWVTLKGSVGIRVPIPREITEKNGEKRVEKVLTDVATQGAGYAFGELALLDKIPKPRAATIYCKENSEFAVLSKKDFQQILLAKEEQRLFEQVNFLQGMKVFSHWTYHSIRNLYLLANKREFCRGNIVYNQGDKAEHMYIIKSGEFKVSFHAKYQKDYHEFEDESAKIRNKFLKKTPSRPVEIAILAQPEMFGIEELIDGTSRMHNISCISQSGIVLEVKHKDVKAIIFQDAIAYKWIQKYLSSRSRLHSTFIESMYCSTNNVKNYLMRTKDQNSKNKKQEELVNNYLGDATPELQHSNKGSQKHNERLSQSPECSTSPHIKQEPDKLAECRHRDSPLSKRIQSVQAWTHALRNLNSVENSYSAQQDKVVQKIPDEITTKLSITERVYKERDMKLRPYKNKLQTLAVQDEVTNRSCQMKDSYLSTAEIQKNYNLDTSPEITWRSNNHAILAVNDMLGKGTDQITEEGNEKLLAFKGTLSHLSVDSMVNFKGNNDPVVAPSIMRGRFRQSESTLHMNTVNISTISNIPNTRGSTAEHSPIIITRTAPTRFKDENSSNNLIRFTRLSSVKTSQGQSRDLKYTSEKVVLNKLVEIETKSNYRSLSKLSAQPSIDSVVLRLQTPKKTNQLLYNTTISWSALQNPTPTGEIPQLKIPIVNIHTERKKRESNNERMFMTERVKSSRFVERRRPREDSGLSKHESFCNIIEGLSDQQITEQRRSLQTPKRFFQGSPTVHSRNYQQQAMRETLRLQRSVKSENLFTNSKPLSGTILEIPRKKNQLRITPDDLIKRLLEADSSSSPATTKKIGVSIPKLPLKLGAQAELVKNQDRACMTQDCSSESNEPMTGSLELKKFSAEATQN